MGGHAGRAQRPPARGVQVDLARYRMITSAIIPRPLAKLPWRLIFLVAGIAMFGLIVLYSAAGGSAQPGAGKQGNLLLFFLALAIAMSWMSEGTIKAIAFPLYGLTLIMLIGV